MPISYRIDTQDERIIVNLTGSVSLEEIFDTIKNALRDPAFKPGFNVLSDHRGVDRVITPGELESTVSLLIEFAGLLRETKWAIVTVKPASYGMMRMLEVHAERIPMKVKVFKEMDAAEHWLSSSDTPA